MTVGILTYHWQDDYGTALQAYAMRLAVEDLGHQPLFIDLCLPYAPTNMAKITGAFRHRRFEEFRRLFLYPLSLLSYRSLIDLRRNPPLCDCYLTGGPGVWNPITGGDLLPAYFLAFGPESARRIAYAPSSGLIKWEEAPAFPLPEISRALSRFTSILLSSSADSEICRNLFGHTGLNVVEPLLLFDRYPELTDPFEVSDEIVYYTSQDDTSLEDAVLTFAAASGRHVHFIGRYRNSNALGLKRTDSVREWAARIAGAGMVITDSPEAMIIAILYHRPFAIRTSAGPEATRVRSILGSLGMKNHLISDIPSHEKLTELQEEDTNWHQSDLRLGAMRTESRRLLRQALS